jgi:hypothetical protein
MVNQVSAIPRHLVSKKEARNAPDHEPHNFRYAPSDAPPLLSLPLLENMIRNLSLSELEELAYSLIGQLDELETDPDCELSDDEHDGSGG